MLVHFAWATSLRISCHSCNKPSQSHCGIPQIYSVCFMVVYCFHSCSQDSSHNLRARCKGTLLCCVGLLLPLILAVNFLATAATQDMLKTLLGKPGAESLNMYLVSKLLGRFVWMMDFNDDKCQKVAI